MGIGRAAGTLGRGEGSAGCGLYKPETSGQAGPADPLSGTRQPHSFPRRGEDHGVEAAGFQLLPCDRLLMEVYVRNA